MSLKKIIIGEPMPDKNDPKYKERYEREVEAGRKFAEKIKLPWLFGKIQLWANDNRKAFLVIVFGIVIGCFALNIFNMVRAYNRHNSRSHGGTAVERVDSALQNNLHHFNNR